MDWTTKLINNYYSSYLIGDTNSSEPASVNVTHGQVNSTTCSSGKYAVI